MMTSAEDNPMTRINPANERVKRRYFIFLGEARRCGEATIDGVAKALSRYETFSKWQDFRRFQTDQAVAFKRHLCTQLNQKTGEQLSLSTIRSTLQALEAFFKWLSGQQGFKSAIAWSDAQFFRLPRKEMEAAKASQDRPIPSLEQIHHVLGRMPIRTDVERRDRAVVAAAIVTGARDGALSSACLRHVDHIDRVFVNDGRTMRTKFSKSFRSWFFPVGGDAEAILIEWVIYLRTVLMFGDDDPLFPATRVGLGASGTFEPMGLTRESWADAAPIRGIFRHAFKQAGLPYYTPHSFRTTLGRLGQQVCDTMEEHKAWSQNLGHENVHTTLMSYGKVDPLRQAEVMKAMTGARRPDLSPQDSTVIAALRQVLRAHDVEL
jgi:integrase/recombinase XerD